MGFTRTAVCLVSMLLALGCSTEGGANDSGGAKASGGGTGSGASGSGASERGEGGAGIDPGPSVTHDPADDFPDCAGHAAQANDAGIGKSDLRAPFPTLEHATLVLDVTGDANGDAVTTVRFRQDGGSWFLGTPLRRARAGALAGFSWNERLSGSLFGLAPGTPYDVEVHVSDPDGGCFIAAARLTTRAVPAASAQAVETSVTPGSLGAALTAAKPGDILQLQTGNYSEIVVPNDGEAGAPLVIRGGAGVTVNGDVRLDGRSHVMVEDLHVVGKVKFNGGNHIAITGCTIETDEDGIVAYARSENAYIADNVITGPSTWTEPSLGASGDNKGEGIALTGAGHVIIHNRVSGFRDGISLLEDTAAVDQFSIDILRNEITECLDDAIEADFCAHNCRISENRITNAFIAMSSQPGLGGPTYFIRNVSYNVILSAFKLQRGSIGDVVLHNTTIKNGDALGIYTDDVFSGQLFRNNVFLGGAGTELNGWQTGEGHVVSLWSAADDFDLAYDAYGSDTGGFTGRIGSDAFTSLSELNLNTRASECIEVGLSAFEASIAYPALPLTVYSPQDLRPSAEAALVDSGEAISGINSGFLGEGPDRGALEHGRGLPQYGPR